MSSELLQTVKQRWKVLQVRVHQAWNLIRKGQITTHEQYVAFINEGKLQGEIRKDA
jgi:hypothetical protein